MPGLFGYWSKEKQHAEPAWLDAMARSMQHQPGLRVEVNTYPGFSAGRVHLGYLQPVAQPFTDATKRYSLWIDGEFNNTSDLRRLFDLDDLVTKGDAALALTLFLKAGWAFLSEVDGLFTIALYNHKTHQLTLVNDRYGLRPLYWIETAYGFGYAGEVRALLKIPEVNVSIDPLAVNEWFSFGYLLRNRTWIEGIELFPPATIMQVTAEGVRRQWYWSWQEIESLPTTVDEEEIVEELGRLWCQAVERRVDDKRVGQFLSGGLDSRAILAALPPTKYPYHTLTFGAYGCEDERIACQVSELKGVEHHFIEINDHNWLPPRIDAVWRTDGMGRVLDLHGGEVIPLLKQYCDIQLNGFLGDATVGGSYLGATDPSIYLNKKIVLKSKCGLEMPEALNYLQRVYSQENLLLDRFLVVQRGRRFINTGPIMASAFLEIRMPFFDKDFLIYVFSLPDRMRAGSYIYNKMLLKYFPEFYRSIPCQKTGLPIGSPPWRHRINDTLNFTGRIIRFVSRKLKIDLPAGRKNYTNYPLWLRTEPARSFVNRILLDDEPYHAEYVDPNKAQSVVQTFMETDNNLYLSTIGLLLTFEVYLRQLFGKGDGIIE